MQSIIRSLKGRNDDNDDDADDDTFDTPAVKTRLQARFVLGRIVVSWFLQRSESNDV
jgi:hypothetical protein